MDINGLPIEGFQSINLSAGLGAVPPLSASLRDDSEGTADVTESEMEHIILEYKAAQTAKEAEKVLKKNASDGRMSRILDGLEDEFF